MAQGGPAAEPTTTGLNPALHVNAKARTYLGQDARIVRAATISAGRVLYALKTRSGTVATAWDDPGALRAYAQRRYLNLQDERS